jgi:hypothetical protein
MDRRTWIAPEGRWRAVDARAPGCRPDFGSGRAAAAHRASVMQKQMLAVIAAAPRSSSALPL